MGNDLLSEATRQYVRQHKDDDVRMLALRGCKDPEVDLPMALQQIQGRQTARRKLPSWAAIEGIVYPQHISMEQCSSELTARHKAGVARHLLPGTKEAEAADGKPARHKLIDLTGGFGVDFSFMARAFGEAVYVERDANLCAMASHNFSLLGLGHAATVCSTAEAFLSSLAPRQAPATAETQPLTVVYIDPARRDTHGQRTYALSDCTPDAAALMPRLLSCAHYVLLKLSPMLDWRKAIADLSPHRVAGVHIVAVDNECKELLLLLSADAGPAGSSDTVAAYGAMARGGERAAGASAPRLVCTDLHCRDGSRTDYSPGSAAAAPPPSLPQPGAFLYEPNAAIMKAGCFSQLAADLAVSAIAPNSHLFTSPRPVGGFPGRTFRIQAISTMNKRDLRHTLANVRQANIAVRNFPLSAEELRRRLKLADGGTDYIFATTLADGTHSLLLCTKDLS